MIHWNQELMSEKKSLFQSEQQKSWEVVMRDTPYQIIACTLKSGKLMIFTPFYFTPFTKKRYIYVNSYGIIVEVKF